jgi:hypothetical protein
MSFVTNFGLKAIHSKAFCCRYLHSTSASSFFLPTNIKRGYRNVLNWSFSISIEVSRKSSTNCENHSGCVKIKKDGFGRQKFLVGCCMLMMLSYDTQFEGQQ